MSCGRRKCAAAQESGFTLIEILVAFAIAVISLGLLFRIYAGTGATTLLAEEYQFAVELAQSLVSEVAVTEQAVRFERRGVHAGKYRWRSAGEADAEGASATPGDWPDAAPYRLRTILVEVSWPSRDRERQVVLRALRPWPLGEIGSREQE